MINIQLSVVNIFYHQCLVLLFISFLLTVYLNDFFKQNFLQYMVIIIILCFQDEVLFNNHLKSLQEPLQLFITPLANEVQKHFYNLIHFSPVKVIIK